MSAPAGAERFREAALAEARRYGSDRWVVVRELLQNARDAGATSVRFHTTTSGAATRLSCRDDGRGLTFDEAQRDLFTLYASRKHGRDAGRFGVGFWSVLLLEPARVTVRSWPGRGEPWEVSWDGALTAGRRDRPAAGAAGTEVVLDLDRPDGVSAAVFAAAWRHARFLRRRDGRAPLVIEVDGRSATAPFQLAAPSMAFRRRGLRGVVGLGAQPRVELFAKGLLVRVSASLEDLLAPGARPLSGSATAGLPGLSPQFLLDSDDLDLLLSRGDARSDDALARVVTAAREELDRLLDRQLARSGRRPWRLTRPRAAAALGALAAGVGLGAMVVPRLQPPGVPTLASAAAATSDESIADTTGSAAGAAPIPYRDPRARYAGPILDPLDQEPRDLALRYQPSDRAWHLVVLRIESFDAAGRPRMAREPDAPYAGDACREDCVAFELSAAGPSWTSLPIPTGHRLDPGSLVVDGRPAQAWTTPSDEALVRLDERTVVLRYRTGPAAWRARAQRPAAIAALLEPGTRAIAGVPILERPAAASRWVRSRVRDSRTRDVALRFAAAVRGGQDFARTALELGAGDCDVQNGIVMRLLQASGVPARLAVGYQAVDGIAIPGLHAWVEHQADGATWRVEDTALALPRLARAMPLARADHSEELAPVSDPTATPDRSSRLSPSFPLAEVGDPPVESRLPLFTWPLAALLVAAGAHALWTRPRRAYRLAATTDLSGLLRGALRSPAAATRLPALLERALVPRHYGGRVSLAEADAAAAARRLFAARRASELARRARAEGGLVLDASRPEGRTVADALAAVDLDDWDDRLASRAAPGTTGRVNRYLEWAGERWRVHLGLGIGAPRILDLPRSRVVLVDAPPEWLDADRADAVRSVVGHVTALLGLSDERRAALLAPLGSRTAERDAR